MDIVMKILMTFLENMAIVSTASVGSEGDYYVHKICRTGQYDNLIQFIDRIVIQNTLCPAAALEVEGFGRDSQLTDPCGEKSAGVF